MHFNDSRLFACSTFTCRLAHIHMWLTLAREVNSEYVNWCASVLWSAVDADQCVCMCVCMCQVNEFCVFCFSVPNVCNVLCSMQLGELSEEIYYYFAEPRDAYCLLQSDRFSSHRIFGHKFSFIFSSSYPLFVLVRIARARTKNRSLSHLLACFGSLSFT